MNKEKINSNALEFQPDAITMALRPLPLTARLGVWIGLTFFIVAIIASYFCKVDIIVNATGKIISQEHNVVLKPLDRTVIKSIKIRVGDYVKKGDILIEFDPTINQAEEERLESDLSSLQAQYNRWTAEFLNKPYEISNQKNKDEQLQFAIFKKRDNFYKAKIGYYDSEINKINANIISIEKNIIIQNERFHALLEKYEMYKNLHKDHVSSKRELLEIKMQKLQLEADISQLENSILTKRYEKQSTLENRKTFIMEWQKDITEQLVQVELTLNTTQKSLDKVLQLNKYVNMIAPCNAIVHEIASFPVGSAVREAEALITLVPVDNHMKMELEAEIPARDIGQVKLGDKVRIKLNAFPFQKYGTLDGVLKNISEDTFQREQENQLETPTYYRGIITISGKLKHVPNTFRLIPGMEAQAEIKVGVRRVIEYIIYPLIKSLDEAIREP